MKSVRLSLNIPQSVADDLKSLSHLRSKTVTEIVKDAIATEMWVMETKRSGRRVIVTDADGENERELVILR